MMQQEWFDHLIIKLTEHVQNPFLQLSAGQVQG